MNKTIIVNLFGGPGSGKSTAAASIFALLKAKGINCELVTEYAKDVTWQENFNTLKNQVYVFGKQHNRIFHLKGKVDVVITDSPIIIGLVYCDWSKVSRSLETLAFEEFNHHDSHNINIFVNRVKEYNPSGRNQSEDEARVKDKDIKYLLEMHNIEYDIMDGNEELPNKVANHILDLLNF